MIQPKKETYSRGATLTIKVSDGRFFRLEEPLDPREEYRIGADRRTDVQVSGQEAVIACLRCVGSKWWIFFLGEDVGIKPAVDSETFYRISGPFEQPFEPYPSLELPGDQCIFQLMPGNCAVIGDTTLEFDYDAKPLAWKDLPVTSAR